MTAYTRTAAFVVAFVLSVSPAFTYVTQSTRWSAGDIVMELQLGTSSRTLLDGSASWGESAEHALADWNEHLGTVRFKVVRDSTAPVAGNNSRNNVFWSSTAYGKSFDDYASPTQSHGIIALTLTWRKGSRRVESDVIFKNTLSWNSYDGVVRRTTRGTLLDLHRVALHEFGHVLGLGHPNDSNQTVIAQMNSAIGDLDALADDDIAGVEALYGR